MQDRPTSVTIVGWVLIVLGGLGAIGLLMAWNSPQAQQIMALSPLPPIVQQLLGFAGVVISLICGLGVLQRKNWARWLYVIWNVASIGLALFTSPAQSLLLLSVAMVAVIAFFLFWKPANAWFGGSEPNPHAAG